MSFRGIDLASLGVEEIAPDLFMWLKVGGEPAPVSLDINGVRFFRFMDFLYIPKEELDELSPVEVENLCRVRAERPHLITNPNNVVQNIFRCFIRRVGPLRLFEIGAGNCPILESDGPIEYVASDADREIFKFKNADQNTCHFSRDEWSLQFADGYFDMMVAVFVFQFRIYPRQISELYRCLASTGIMLANVYRRKMAARQALESELVNAGFKVMKLKDPRGLCRDHEYWLMGRSEEILFERAELLKPLIV